MSGCGGLPAAAAPGGPVRVSQATRHPSLPPALARGSAGGGRAAVCARSCDEQRPPRRWVSGARCTSGCGTSSPDPSSSPPPSPPTPAAVTSRRTNAPASTPPPCWNSAPCSRPARGSHCLQGVGAPHPRRSAGLCCAEGRRAGRTADWKTLWAPCLDALGRDADAEAAGWTLQTTEDRLLLVLQAQAELGVVLGGMAPGLEHGPEVWRYRMTGQDRSMQVGCRSPPSCDPERLKPRRSARLKCGSPSEGLQGLCRPDRTNG